MKVFAVGLSVVFAALSASPASALERLEARTFATDACAAVKITAHRALISVESTEGKSVRIQVAASTPRANLGAAERALASVDVVWAVRQSEISLAVADRSERGVRLLANEDERTDVVITVSIPRACCLDLATGEGDIRVGEVAGDVRLQTGFGTISCRYIDGALRARNAGGAVVVSHCTGDVDIAAVRGSIRTGTVGGHAVLSTVTGDIDIFSARRGLRAQTDGGDIVAGIPRQLAGDVSVKTNGGSVTLQIDPAAGLQIEASTRWGKVRAVRTGAHSLPLAIASGGDGRRSLAGTLNGGGPLIQVRANGGHVNLAGEAPPFG
jgi:hypothetical protein